MSDRSQDGREPDPDLDGDPTHDNAPTVVEMVAVPRVGAAMQVASVAQAADGKYAVVYSIRIENFGQLLLSAVNVEDNLRQAFPSPATFRVVEARSRDFEIDPRFDGVDHLRLLAGTDSLGPGQRGTVSLTLNIAPNGGGAWYESQAIAFATAPDGSLVTDTSTAGSNADPNGNGDPADDHQATETLLAQSSVTGFAEATVRLAALPIDLDVTSMLFNATLRVDDFSARLDAKLTNTLFDLISIAASGPLTGLPVTSTLAFNPSTLSFISWQTTFSADILGAGLSDTIYVTVPQASSYTLARISASIGGSTLQVSLKFGLCPFAFWNTTICVDWNWAVCDTPLSACVSFGGSEGFESLEVTANDIPLLENVLGVGASLDVRIEYTVTQKSIAPTVRFVPDWLICPEIRLLGEVTLTTPNPGIQGIRIYGATVDVSWGDVAFHVADSFGDDKNAVVTGKAAYFAVFSLETSIDSCCGSPGRLQGAVYFEHTPPPVGTLFGVGLVEGLVEFQLSRHITAAFTVDFQPMAPNWMFTARLRTLW